MLEGLIFVCDHCGKKVTHSLNLGGRAGQYLGVSPMDWYRVEITKGKGLMGTSLLEKDCCSLECLKAETLKYFKIRIIKKDEGDKRLDA